MEISHRRVTRISAGLGLAGSVAALAMFGWRDALGFAAGAAISLASYASFARVAASLGDSGRPPAMGSALFLAVRYLLIGVAIYVMIGYLRSTPGVLVAGLLTSFLALLIELLLRK